MSEDLWKRCTCRNYLQVGLRDSKAARVLVALWDNEVCLVMHKYCRACGERERESWS